MKVRVDAEQGVPRVQVRQKPWVLAETLRESGPVLPDAMGRQVAAWDRRRGAGPGQEGQGGSTAPGRSGRGAGAQPHVSVTSLDCLPQTLDFPRLDDHRRKLSQSSPSLLPARNGTRSSHQASERVQLLAAWSLSGPPSVPWRLLPTSGLLWPWAHLPALNLQDPGSPQGVPHPSVPTPQQISIAFIYGYFRATLLPKNKKKSSFCFLQVGISVTSESSPGIYRVLIGTS